MANQKTSRASEKKARQQGLRILLSNDDGINAPGLRVLQRIARQLSNDIWIVAPEVEQSGASHSLTLHEPLRVRTVSRQKFAVSGTPTDCVVMAVNKVITGRKPTLLLSGVNRGANLGEDVTYSGTIAAAMEGTLLGIPSIAFSQVYRGVHPIRWATAEHHAPLLIRRLLKVGWPEDVLINVNFPDLAADAVNGTEVSVQGQREAESIVIHEREDPRRAPYYWIGFRRVLGTPPRHTDLGVIDSGGISVTPLKLDLTHRAARKALQTALK